MGKLRPIESVPKRDPVMVDNGKSQGLACRQPDGWHWMHKWPEETTDLCDPQPTKWLRIVYG